MVGTWRTISALVWVASAHAGCRESNPAYQGVGATDGSSAFPDGSTPADGAPADRSGQTPAPDARPVDTSPLAVGLIGYWKLDDATGSTKARDHSGNGNDGVLEDINPATAWVPGRLGDALTMSNNLSTGGVRIEASPTVNSIRTGLTVAAWIYFQPPDGTPGELSYYAIVSRQKGTDYAEYFGFSLLKDRVRLFLMTMVGVANPTVGRATVTQNRWTHLCATYDGQVMRTYVDGALDDSVARTVVVGSGPEPVYIGNNVNGDLKSEPFRGKIDEVLLYSRALSAGEVAQLARGEVPPGL